jgi:hypothetical protein
MSKSLILISTCLVAAGLTSLGIARQGAPRVSPGAARTNAGQDGQPPQWKVLVKRLAERAATGNAEVQIEEAGPGAVPGKSPRTFPLIINFESLESDRKQYLLDWQENKKLGRGSVQYVRLERIACPPPRDAAEEPFAPDRYVSLPVFADPCREANRELYGSSLVITDLGVVEDENRTKGLGPWSFGFLITQLANQQKTGLSPSEFVSRWLKHWDEPQVINQDQMPARPGIVEAITKVWQDVSGDGKPLDLEKAPFRLLAIVNRLDLRKNRALGMGRDGAGEAGEARFVFCAVGRNDEPLPFNVIFEYAITENVLKQKGFAGVRKWGEQWLRLKDNKPGTEEFNSALEKITNQFTQAGVSPGAPNDCALAQLRTNTEFGIPWELREFRIDRNSHVLKQVPVTDTPQIKYNMQDDISNYLKDPKHRDALLAERHHLSARFPLALAGSATAQANRIWKGPDGVAIDFKARRFFSMSTCNGCHAGEGFAEVAEDTGDISLTDKGPPPHFTHIRPRARGQEAKLSLFLTGTKLWDQVAKEWVERNELERRANDLSSLVRYGLVYELQRMYLPAVH